MQLSRLIQPRRLSFWLILVLNAMTMGLVWIVEQRALEGGLRLVLLAFALGNAMLGMVLTWRMLRDPGPGDAGAGEGDASR